MFNVIENEVFELIAKLADLRDDERGQTSAEYIAVTAVAVVIALTVIYATFSGQLTNAINTIGTNLESWVSSSVPSST